MLNEIRLNKESKHSKTMEKQVKHTDRKNTEAKDNLRQTCAGLYLQGEILSYIIPFIIGGWG